MNGRIKIVGTDIVADYRILVVDDVKATRKVIYTYLKNMGFRDIKQAKDGKVAWDMVCSAMEQEMPFEFIISDIRMPEENGLKLLERVREKFSNKHVKFLIISSENDNPVVLSAVELGASNYIIKPFTAETFQEKILSVLTSDA